MVTYEEVKDAINGLKRDVLKYLYAEVVSRRYSIFNQMRSRINSIMSDVNSLISAKVSEAALGYLIEQYYLGSANAVGKKAIGFNYSDETVDMMGLDGQTYDNPSFPQIRLTPEELTELTNAMKDVPARLRRGVCVLRVKAEDVANMPREPDEEDALFAYYFADAVTVMEHHEVDYGAAIFGQDILIRQYFYQTVDALFIDVIELKLEKVEAESLCLGWFWDNSFGDYKVKICVDIKPTLTLSDPSDATKKRKTAAMFVMNIYNALSVAGTITIDRFEVPLIANKHYLAILGAEVMGLRSVEIPVMVNYP